jgi:putative intracellular protease/amidase
VWLPERGESVMRMHTAVPLRQRMQMCELLGSIEVNARSSMVRNRWRAICALLVSSTTAVGASAASASERIAAYEARFGRSRPVVAVVGENSGTELIDFVIPYGILSRSGIADVVTVATHAGLMQMRPALQVAPDATLESFDEQFPEGADYVVVPAIMAMESKAPPNLEDWIKEQAGKGASIVSICDGALIVARAGLLQGRRATGHWATYTQRKHDYPDTQWLQNTRYVADGKVISSAGVTAAIPLSVALIEAIAGKQRATEVAREIGLDQWSSEHDSEQFRLPFSGYALAIRNWLLPTREIALPVSAGVDEVAIALTADALSRTYRSRAYTWADSERTVESKHGLKIVPDRVIGNDKTPRIVVTWPDGTPVVQRLDETLSQIASLFGRPTSKLVALQLEYPRT